jgi:hypothetical protein
MAAAERGVGFAEDKVAQWGRYAGDPTPEQLTRYFHLSPTDVGHARRRRSPATQLGYASSWALLSASSAHSPLSPARRDQSSSRSHASWTSTQASGYFGTGRGITLFNYVADNPTSLTPTEIVTDTASASDLNFGLCQLLGYRYMPRLADLPDRRLFRIHPARDYGPLNPLARHRINIGLIRDHWDDICRVVGTLHTKAAVPSEVIRALQRAGRPVVLARAIAEIGKVVRTIATLDYATRPEQRRRILIQLNRQESRHALARAVCHGRRGQIHQAYRSGQEQQLGALGLVTNAIVLWNTTYMNHAIDHLDRNGTPTAEGDQERLSPL